MLGQVRSELDRSSGRYEHRSRLGETAPKRYNGQKVMFPVSRTRTLARVLSPQGTVEKTENNSTSLEGFGSVSTPV